jgi:AbrB family looped-hinge helix DNA binding protein
MQPSEDNAMAKAPREIWASVTERGQVTIPAEVRKALGIEKRGKLAFIVDDGVVVLKKPRFSTVSEAAGSIPASKHPKTWEEAERQAKEEVVERYLQKMREGNA